MFVSDVVITDAVIKYMGGLIIHIDKKSIYVIRDYTQTSKYVNSFKHELERGKCDIVMLELTLNEESLICILYIYTYIYIHNNYIQLCSIPHIQPKVYRI